MKKKSFRILSLIMAFVMVIGSFGSFSQTVQAAEKEYEIYPIPHTMAYQDGSFTISDDVNVVLESGIDEATIARLEEVAEAAGVTAYSVSNAVVEGKTNILVGINGSEESVDSYFWEKFVVTDGLFDKLDSYVLTSMDGVITVLGKDADAAFYGLTSLYHIANQLEDKSIRNFIMEDYADVASRGFIEGYYGNPWSVEDRMNLMEWGGYYKLNSYFYAPKDDPKHNSNWRELYTEEEIETKIKPLAEAGNASKCRFVFALHPYMYNAIASYSSNPSQYQADLEIMQAKFAQVIEAGVRQIAILADDAGNVGSSNYIKMLTDMTAWVKEMQETYPDLKLTIPFCTQEYMGNGQSYYADFPENVQIVMTGGKVWGEVSNSFTTTFTNNVGRGPYMWINWPCTDNSKQHLIMGGYTTFLHAGVDPSKIQGIVLNPMQQSEPSKVAIFGNACYSWNIWETNDEADQCWNDSFKHVDHKSAEETAASNALRELSKHMINQNMDSRVTALQESVDLSPALTEAKNILNANGTLSDEQIANLIAEFTKLQEAAVTYRNEASDTNIRDQIVYWLNCWDDTTEAAIAYLNAIKAIQDGESNAVVWDYYSIGQTAFENSKTYGFHYVDHTEYAEVGVQHIVPFIKAMDTNLSVKVATIVDPSKVVATFITNRSDTPTGDIKNVTDGSTSTEVVYKSPSNIEEGTYVGIAYSKPITINDVTFNMGTTSNSADRFASAKIQYTVDGTEWVDLNDETYTTADITVEGLNITAKGIRLVNTAYVTNKWLGVREITVNKGSQTEQPGDTSLIASITNNTGLGVYSGNINNVIDGDTSTNVWFNAAPSAGATITVELSRPIILGAMKFTQDSGDKITQGKFEYRDEAGNWNELSTFSSAGAVISEDYSSQYITATALRIVNGAGVSVWWKVYEWEVAEAVLESDANVLTNAELEVTSTYTDTMTSLNAATGVTLNPDEYVGVVLPRIKDISAINVELGAPVDGLILEASKNMVDWEVVTLEEGEELPDARYIRLYNMGSSPVTFDIVTFEVYSNEISGPHLYESNIGVNSSWGAAEDSRNNGAAFDGKIDTTTEFADFVSEGQYIIYDLGQTRNIWKLEMYCSDSAVNYIRDAKVQISNDLTVWADVFTIGDGVENTGDSNVTCINSDAGYSQATSSYPNKVSIEGEITPTEARYIRILMTAANNERAVLFNEIEINEGEYVPVNNDPTFQGTLEAQGFAPQNMIDGDLTTAYKPGSNAAGSIVYTLSDNLDVKRMNIVQKGTASDAKVSVLVKENGEKVWAEVGTLSKSLNEISLPLWDQIFAVKFEWEANKIPTISEIVMLCGEEYASSARPALQEYVDGLNVKEADYTTASYAAFEAKLTAAEAVLADNNSTEAALANALKELQAAVAGLEKRGDTALVTAELTAIAELKEADYTAASWAVLKAAVTKAEALAANENATEAEVAAMVEELQQAKAALVSNAAVGKDALAAYIADNDLNNLDTSVYMSEGAKAFTDALAGANSLLKDSGVTAAQYENALKLLQDARAALILKATQAEVDALKTLIDSYKEESYTASSWAVFAATADKIKADADKEQTSADIAAMTAELNTAAKALVLRGNAGTLETLLEVADKYDADKYTEESFAGILAVVAKIEKALENAEELLQAEVDALDKEFWAADKALVQVDDSGDSGNSGNTGSSGSTSQPQPSTPASPTTGDTANILAYAALAVIALAGVYFFRRKRA